MRATKIYFRWEGKPHPEVVMVRDNVYYTRPLLFSIYTIIARKSPPEIQGPMKESHVLSFFFNQSSCMMPKSFTKSHMSCV